MLKYGSISEFLGNFFQIKKMIALMLTIVFCILAVRGSITSSEFLTIFSMIISFYFGQSTTRQAVMESKEQNKTLD